MLTIEQLCQDHTSIKSRHYEETWVRLIDNLDHDDPAVRLSTVNSALLASESLSRTLISTKLKTSLVKKLCANMSGDEHWLGRARSGLLLGKCVSFMLQHDFPMTLRSVAFKATLHFFISSVFPADITRTMKYDAAVFHRDTYVSPFVLQTRIIMVHALGCFFRCPEAYEPEFLDYIDTLFSAILQSDQNVLLQIAVIHVLANHLPVINRNRLRVEVFYREAILKLFQSANGCNLLGLDETPASKSRLSSSGEEGDGLNDSEDSNASTETSNPSVVAATSAAPAKSVLIKLALIEMDHFSKIWYPQLHDSTIMYLQSNPGTSKVLSTNEGYGWRRWQWLTTREAPTFHQIRANRNIPTVPEISPPFILKKGLQLSAYHRSAEVALDPSQYKVAPKNKPALKISTHSFSKVTDSVKTEEDGQLNARLAKSEEKVDVASIHSSLSFNAGTLIFNSAPASKDVFLQNKSITEEQYFSIQVGGGYARHVSVHPAIGIIPPGETKPIKIIFKPRPDDVRRQHELSGFLRVWSKEGFPLERISFNVQNLPAIRILPEVLDFHLCPVGETRVQMLTISNLLNADCHAVMLVVPSQTSSAFTLSQTQTLFQPREKRLFPIRLTATSEGNVSDQLIVIAYGGEMHRVTLKCRVGSALKLYDTKIDLGPTDIYYGSIGKRILLKNVDDYASLPITLWKSSTDIIVNGGKPLLLDPGEQRRVKIELLSSFTGPRLETVEFYGMNSFPCRLEISAFSGPTLMAPTMEDIIFPSVLAHAESSIVFPVVNLSPFVAQFFIFVPSDSCFALQLLDIEHSHSKRNVAVGTQIIMDSKEHIAGGTSGLIVTIGGKLTANIKVAINQKIPGAYKSTLGVNSIKPKKHPLASFNLCALVLDISLTQQEGAVNKLRKSVAFPANNQDTFIASAPVEKRPPLAYTVFELQPSVLVIRLNPRFVSTNSSQRDDPVDTVTLTNSTSSKQPYHIMLSKPFLTDVPLDGFIEPMTAMEIPIKIVPNYFSTLQPETLNYTCIGGISIYNEDKKFIVVNSAIIGVHSDMMMAEIRSKSDTFDMTPLKSGEKRTQRIYIRNKTPLEVVWEGKLSYFLQKPVGGASDPRESTIGGGAGGGSAGVSGDSIPFALSTPRIGLKPYEVASFDVHFISNIGTQHSARLFMEYTDPNAGKTSSNSSKAVDIVPKKLNLKSLLFQAATGSVDINTTFDSIIFGDLPVGFQSTKVVTVMNPSTIPVTFSIMPSSKEFEMPMWHTIPESSKIDVPIKFISKQPRAYAELITFSCRGVTKSIPLVGYSHRPFEVGSNLGMPTLAKVESPEFETGAAGVGGESRREAEDSNPALNDPATDPALYLPPKQADMIQFGYVGTDKPKPKFFILKNLGSTELTIVGISESSQFKWKFLEEVEDSVLESLIGNTQLKCRELQGAISAKISNDRSNLSMGFTQDVIDLAEIDWDETDLKLREEAVFGNSDPIKPKRTSMTKTKESASLVAKKRRYSRVVRMPSIVASRGKHQSEFPFRLEAFQSLPLVLYFSGTEKEMGSAIASIKIEIERESGDLDGYQFWASANIQPPLQLSEKRIEFGVCAVHDKYKTSVHFTNNGTSAVPWEVVHEQTKLIPAMKYSMNDAIYADSSMITVFPDQGCLLPGCTQTVDILFSPSVAQHEVISSFLLKSGDYSSQNISIRGVGASTNLTIDKEQLSFGILRVGSFKETKIRMINCGILTSRYFLECEGLVFTADPEQGMLDGDGFVDITVKFYPKKDGRFTGMITITSLLEQGAYSDPLYITMDGEGSYPELSIPTKVVDYGTALFGTANIKEITIENKGSAEANILFSTTCPSLTLDYNMEEPIPPYSTKQVTLVYYPNEIETLEAKVYLRSTDSRSDYFMIQVKGTVGLPKLVITPSHFFDELHFGVCPTHKKHERIVTLLNDGNIPLSLAFQVELLKRTPVEGSDDIQEPKSMVLSENALWVEPSTGHISMGEIATFKVIFCPTHIADYEFKLTLRYDFKFIAAVFKGTGGRAILKVDTPLSYIDFGICRLGRVFKKVFTITNTGNLGVDFKLRPEPRGKDWSAYNDEIGFGDDRKSLIKTPGGGIVMLSSEEKAALISSSTGQPDASVLSESLNQKFIIAQEEPDWVRELSNFGFKFPRPNSHCAAYSKVDFVVEFCPHSESSVSIKVRMFIDGCSPEDVEIRGRAAKPKLTVYQGSAFQKLTGGGGSSSGKTGTDPIAGMGAKLKKHEIPSIDLGVHPVDSDSMSSIQLVNSGPFGCDFMIQPFSLREFEVYPARGYIEPDSNMPLKIYFRPSAESRYQTIMRILWEESPILLQISASGGIGKLEVAYLEEKDKAMEGLDFGMVPFNTETDKRCFIYNVGMVPVNISSAVDNQEFSVAYMAEPAEWKGLSAAKAAMVKKRGIAWAPKAKTKLLPGRYIELAVRFWTITTNTSSGNVIVRSEGNEFPIPLRGKGGTIQISHRGDLSLGDIASSFTYKRKITLINSGSISTTLNMEWMIVGHSGESGAATVKLIETYSVIDPRSGFARQQFFKDKGLNPDGSGGVGAGHSLYALTARDRWRLIQRLILKKTDKKDDMSASTYGTRSRSSSSGNNNSNNGDSSGSDLHQELSGGERRQSRLASGNASSLALGSSIKKGLVGQGSAFFKRRQMFYHLISTIPVSSQSVSTTRPFISVDPPSCTLPSYGDVTIMVEVNLSTEDTFLATLLIKPAIVSMPSYEIPLTATPKAVNIVCDDTRIINFYRQPIGQAETLERTFTNIGKKDILFLFKNPNQSLAINPDRGLLEVGKSLKVEFIFTPTEETPQKSDIIFEPNCSQPIRLKLFGGGGYVKCSLARYRRFDFGHCMIAKDTVSLLPVANEGSAILHLTRFELTESDAFFKGTEWPESRVSLHPGSSFNLPIVFHPSEDNPPPGKLLVGTNSESWEIELIGMGREAVLIISKVALEYTDCLIGNSYEQRLGLKNVGDVNYPVSFKFETPFSDIEFHPESLIVQPFSESFVKINYTPTQSVKTNLLLIISSPYSTHKIPIILHSGTASLDFSHDLIDFGMFERISSPIFSFKLKNTGTVATSYYLKDTVKPSRFSFTNNKGLAGPGKSIEVIITHTRHEVGSFLETLIVKTDLLNKVYHIKVKGHCEEALVHPDELNFVNMGICPVLETTTKPLSITNYGKFPLNFTIKAAYPLKVFPIVGSVEGSETQDVNILWGPSGSYELRTQLSIATNIGNFTTIVRGKSMFPDLGLKSLTLDFGVCAAGHIYSENIVLFNKGKVPLHFTIPPPRDSSFSISKQSGDLAPKEEVSVGLDFCPATFGRLATSVIVECKGINYKEVLVSGIGAVMKMDISPKILELGPCPCDLPSQHLVSFKNSGDVLLKLSFSYSSKDKPKSCTLIFPEPVEIKPGDIAKCTYSVIPHVVGKFFAKMAVVTKEKTYHLPVSGHGVKIVLSERAKRILKSEYLENVKMLTPMLEFKQLPVLEHLLRQFSTRFILDLHLVRMIKDIIERLTLGNDRTGSADGAVVLGGAAMLDDSGVDENEQFDESDHGIPVFTSRTRSRRSSSIEGSKVPSRRASVTFEGGGRRESVHRGGGRRASVAPAPRKIDSNDESESSSGAIHIPTAPLLNSGKIVPDVENVALLTEIKELSEELTRALTPLQMSEKLEKEDVTARNPPASEKTPEENKVVAEGEKEGGIRTVEDAHKIDEQSLQDAPAILHQDQQPSLLTEIELALTRTLPAQEIIGSEQEVVVTQVRTTESSNITEEVEKAAPKSNDQIEGQNTSNSMTSAEFSNTSSADVEEVDVHASSKRSESMILLEGIIPFDEAVAESTAKGSQTKLNSKQKETDKLESHDSAQHADGDKIAAELNSASTEESTQRQPLAEESPEPLVLQEKIFSNSAANESGEDQPQQQQPASVTLLVSSDIQESRSNESKSPLLKDSQNGNEATVNETMFSNASTSNIQEVKPEAEVALNSPSLKPDSAPSQSVTPSSTHDIIQDSSSAEAKETTALPLPAESSTNFIESTPITMELSTTKSEDAIVTDSQTSSSPALNNEEQSAAISEKRASIVFDEMAPPPPTSEELQEESPQKPKKSLFSSESSLGSSSSTVKASSRPVTTAAAEEPPPEEVGGESVSQISTGKGDSFPQNSGEDDTLPSSTFNNNMAIVSENIRASEEDGIESLGNDLSLQAPPTETEELSKSSPELATSVRSNLQVSKDKISKSIEEFSIAEAVATTTSSKLSSSDSPARSTNTLSSSSSNLISTSNPQLAAVQTRKKRSAFVKAQIKRRRELARVVERDLGEIISQQTEVYNNIDSPENPKDIDSKFMVAVATHIEKFFEIKLSEVEPSSSFTCTVERETENFNYILNLPKPKVVDYFIDDIVAPRLPRVEVNLGIITGRPDPFCGAPELQRPASLKAKQSEETEHYHKYAPFPSIRRNKRNAPTVDSFRQERSLNATKFFGGGGGGDGSWVVDDEISREYYGTRGVYRVRK